jgi:hypothetical protein
MKNPQQEAHVLRPYYGFPGNIDILLMKLIQKISTYNLQSAKIKSVKSKTILYRMKISIGKLNQNQEENGHALEMVCLFNCLKQKLCIYVTLVYF